MKQAAQSAENRTDADRLMDEGEPEHCCGQDTEEQQRAKSQKQRRSPNFTGGCSRVVWL